MIEVLSNPESLEFDGDKLRITAQLERSLYMKVNKVLEALGGKWNRSAKAHIFTPYDGGPCHNGDAVTAGEYVDPKAEYEFFETPPELAVQIVRLADVYGKTVLEPSAGKGALAREIEKQGGSPLCVELNQQYADALSATSKSRSSGVVCGDFLKIGYQEIDQVDRVVMNPPFSKNQDILHVVHAFRFLTQRGKLVAIMGCGWTFRQDRIARNFRRWVERIHGHWEDLPDGSFKSSGTMVKTVYLELNKDDDSENLKVGWESA